MNMNTGSDNCQADIKASPRDGVRPALQQRSRATRDRLLAAGKRLLEETDLDGVSIADIAAAADCSVGAFYTRFENKDAYFRALVTDMLAQERSALDALHDSVVDANLIEAIVANAVGSFRRNAGLLRSALRKGMEDPSYWEPIRRHGQVAADLVVGRLSKMARQPLGPEEELRTRFAFQVLYGTLVNALLHQPLPLLLENERLENELSRVFRLTIGPGRD